MAGPAAWMLVGYARGSTKSDEQRRSVDTQVARLKDHGCDRVLVDRGISGFREGGRRGSAFPELIELIASGEVRQIVTCNFDRTQRRSRWGAELLDAMERGRCDLLELDTGCIIDAANPGDVLVAQIRTAVQESESRWRSIKVRQALAKGRSQGRYASGKVPFGYAHLLGEVVAHPTNWVLARTMWEELAALQFNVSLWLKQSGADWSPRGVRCWIGNPTLRGQVKGRPGMHCPALITEQEWHAAEQGLALRATRRGVGLTRRQHLFTGLVRCEGCGKTLHTLTDRAALRLKCMYPPCCYFGRGIAVLRLRAALVEFLAQEAAALADLAADHQVEEPVEAQLLRGRLERMQQLADEGEDLSVNIAAAKERLVSLTTARSGPQRERLLRWFGNPADLALLTDDELRAVSLETVAEILYLGGPNSWRITLRQAFGQGGKGGGGGAA